MQPYKIEIFIYAESQEEALQAQQKAIQFVKNKYQSGTLITARKVIAALDKFKDSFIVNQYFN